MTPSPAHQPKLAQQSIHHPISPAHQPTKSPIHQPLSQMGHQPGPTRITSALLINNLLITPSPRTRPDLGHVSPGAVQPSPDANIHTSPSHNFLSHEPRTLVSPRHTLHSDSGPGIQTGPRCGTVIDLTTKKDNFYFVMEDDMPCDLSMRSDICTSKQKMDRTSSVTVPPMPRAIDHSITSVSTFPSGGQSLLSVPTHPLNFIKSSVPPSQTHVHPSGLTPVNHTTSYTMSPHSIQQSGDGNLKFSEALFYFVIFCHNSDLSALLFDRSYGGGRR